LAVVVWLVLPSQPGLFCLVLLIVLVFIFFRPFFLSAAHGADVIGCEVAVAKLLLDLVPEILLRVGILSVYDSTSVVSIGHVRAVSWVSTSLIVILPYRYTSEGVLIVFRLEVSARLFIKSSIIAVAVCLLLPHLSTCWVVLAKPVVIAKSGIEVSHVILVIKPSLVLHLLSLVWLLLVLRELKVLSTHVLLLLSCLGGLLLQLIARCIGGDSSYPSYGLLLMEFQHVQLILAVGKLMLKFRGFGTVSLQDGLLDLRIMPHLVQAISVSVKHILLTQVELSLDS